MIGLIEYIFYLPKQYHHNLKRWNQSLTATTLCHFDLSCKDQFLFNGVKVLKLYFQQLQIFTAFKIIVNEAICVMYDISFTYNVMNVVILLRYTFYDFISIDITVTQTRTAAINNVSLRDLMEQRLAYKINYCNVFSQFMMVLAIMMEQQHMQKVFLLLIGYGRCQTCRSKTKKIKNKKIKKQNTAKQRTEKTKRQQSSKSTMWTILNRNNIIMINFVRVDVFCFGFDSFLFRLDVVLSCILRFGVSFFFLLFCFVFVFFFLLFLLWLRHRKNNKTE